MPGFLVNALQRVKSDGATGFQSALPQGYGVGSELEMKLPRVFKRPAGATPRVHYRPEAARLGGKIVRRDAGGCSNRRKS